MSARDLAAKVQPGSTVRWDRLERAAFAAHPSVLDEKAVRKPKNNWNLVWGIPLVLVYLFCYLAPIWGTAAISVSRFNSYRQPADERIALAGTLFIFALVLLVVSIVHWFVTGRRRNGLYEVQAALGLTLGGLSVAAVRMYGMQESVVGWQAWAIPILATAGLALVFLVLLTIARVSHGQRPENTDGAGATLAPNKVALPAR